MMDEQRILEALGDVPDPELGISVVDLGLVYGIELRDDAVRVTMTTTSPACPLGGYLAHMAAAAIRRLVPEAMSVDVELVGEPVWHPGMMSEAARRQLGAAGAPSS